MFIDKCMTNPLTAIHTVVADDEFEDIDPNGVVWPEHDPEEFSPEKTTTAPIELAEFEGDDDDEFDIPSLPGTNVPPVETPESLSPGDDEFKATSTPGQPQVRLPSVPLLPEDEEFESPHEGDHITEDEFEEYGEYDQPCFAPTCNTATEASPFILPERAFSGSTTTAMTVHRYSALTAPPPQTFQGARNTDGFQYGGSLSPTSSEDKQRRISRIAARRQPDEKVSSRRSLASEGDRSDRARLRTRGGRRGRPRGKHHRSLTDAFGGKKRNRTDISGASRLSKKATNQPLSSDEGILDDVIVASSTHQRRSTQSVNEVTADMIDSPADETLDISVDESTDETADELTSWSTSEESTGPSPRRKRHHVSKAATAHDRPTKQAPSSGAASVSRETVLTIRIPQETLIDDEVYKTSFSLADCC